MTATKRPISLDPMIASDGAPGRITWEFVQTGCKIPLGLKRHGGRRLPRLLNPVRVEGTLQCKAGRIVVPKSLRERLGFRPDTELEAIEQPGGVLLKRAKQQPSMVKIDGLWVHHGTPELGAKWEQVLEDAREERIESVLKP